MSTILATSHSDGARLDPQEYLKIFERTERMYTATYSPEDNKLRLYSGFRLDPEEYAKVYAAGFRWAPRQDLFVAPSWSPAREDLLLEMCGEIGDEDTSLQERAEAKDERCSELAGKRGADADSAFAAADRIAKQRPFGQPILVGHHSEASARADQRRIHQNMDRGCLMWKRSEYWKARAGAAIDAAEYKLRPDVRARRIKKLEAERRKLVREYTPTAKHAAHPIMQEPYYCRTCGAAPCRDRTDHENPPEPHVYCGAARGGWWVPVASLPAIEKRNARQIAHLDLRLTYEKAMLEAEGASDLLKLKARPKQPPLLNYRGTVETRCRWREGTETLPKVEMTRAEYAKLWADHRGTRVAVDGSHRVRIRCMRLGELAAVFLTDSKEHAVPEQVSA